jgi:hypothetical protein
MKKLLITLSLLIITNSVYAEWTELGQIEDTQYYYDKSSINLVGNIGRIWRYNNNTQANINYKSVIALDEYDCINKTRKIVSFSEYSEYDLKGKETKIAESFLLKTGNFVRPNSIEYLLMEMACKK